MVSKGSCVYYVQENVRVLRKHCQEVWVYISLDIVRSWSSDYAVGLVEELGYCHQLKS